MGRRLESPYKVKYQIAFLLLAFLITDFERTTAYMKVLRTFMESSRGIRRLGAAAIDLAFVACGG